MELDQILKNRRSHRFFRQQVVDKNQILEIIRAGINAPVSCNLQINKYIVVDDKELIERLAKKVSYKFSYAPYTIVALCDSRYTIARKSAIVGTGMALENMILKATDLGLGTCPMAGFGKDKVIKGILGIPDYYEIVLLLSLGYIDQNFQPREIPKIAEENVYAFNDFGNLPTILESDDLDKHTVASIIDYRRRIAPVYLDRFRLNTFKDKYYQGIVDFFGKEICPVGGEKNILDVLSYDGKFLQLLKEDDNFTVNISASDYLQDNLDFFGGKLQIKTYLIDDKNKIEAPDNFFDLMTFVLQLNFTPEIYKLLESIKYKLKDGGSIFVAVVEESSFKIFIKRLKKFYKKYIKKEVYNIYENNPYYKIGPIKYFSNNKILSLFVDNGFRLDKKGLISNYQSSGVKIRYYLFRK